MGDIIAPYCADLVDDGSVPSVVGERHRIHIPHQHIILVTLYELLKEPTRITPGLTLQNRAGAVTTPKTPSVIQRLCYLRLDKFISHVHGSILRT